MSRKKKVLIGVAGFLVVGGIGSAITGGPDETPASETTVGDPSPSETPSPEPETTVEPPVIDPAPPTPEPTVEPESDYADPMKKYDLPMDQDLVFVGLVRDSYPILDDSSAASIVAVAESTCLGIDQGYSLNDQVDIAIASGLGDAELAASIGVMTGAVEFYCPEHSTMN